MKNQKKPGKGSGMAIFYDQIGHLVSDTSLEELHRFASKLGLRREWFQAHQKHPHYDLTTERAKRRAKTLGAKLVRPREILKMSQRLTKERRQP
jgi:hypothetical protein